MPRSKVEKAAHLLDDEMRINISNLRMRLYVTTTDIRALDAAVSLAGEDAVRYFPGTAARWRCEKESTLLHLLQQCIPFMQRQAELAKAVVEFLEADGPEGMFKAMLKVWTLREPRRGGRGPGRLV